MNVRIDDVIDWWIRYRRPLFFDDVMPIEPWTSFWVEGVTVSDIAGHLRRRCRAITRLDHVTQP